MNSIAELKQKYRHKMLGAHSSSREAIYQEFLADLDSLAQQAVPVAANSTCPYCNAPCLKTTWERGGDHGWGDDSTRVRYIYSAPAAAVEVTDDLLNVACAAYNALPHTWPSADREGMRAALVAALGAGK